MRREQLAINSVSTRHADLVEAVAAYAGAGFRNVEWVLPLVHDWLDAGHSVADLRALLQKYDVRSIGGFQAHVMCWGDDEARRANHVLHLRNAQLIDQLGGGTLVVGTDGPAVPSLDALDQVADTLGGLVRHVEGYDVRIALEFNWSPLVRSLASAVRVVEQVDHPQLGILFDPAHWYTTPTKMEDIDGRAVRRIVHVHLDDMRPKPADLSNCNTDRVLPGEGVIDLQAMIAMLEGHGYTGYFSIEMFNEDLWALPAAEAARRCYNSLLPLCGGDRD
jgi:2-keto-myo-inositol isomerase